MGLETGTYIDSLVSTNPVTGDNVSQGDDHIRLLKSTIKASFPNITGAMTLTQAQLNQVADLLTQVPTNAALQASTSGTAIDFTSIPSWVKKITIAFEDVSFDNTEFIEIQIGGSGGIEATGYNGGGDTQNSSVGSSTTNTTGWGVGSAGAAATFNGVAVLTLIDASSNLWCCIGSIYDDGATNSHRNFSGTKTLSATLDRVRIQGGIGRNFDNGNIGLRYEK